MKIGIPKEIKNLEGRVALTPAGARRLVEAGHDVWVQHEAGMGSGFPDQDYVDAGAHIGTAEQAWESELVVKVKEPEESEYGFLRQQIVFTFFHLAGVAPELTQTLLERGTTAIAYETLEDAAGRLPLLAPMSAIAGNMAALVGAFYLARCNGGRGVQLGEVLGQRHGKVVVIGDGVVGYHAARTSWGLGAEVAVAGLFPERGEQLRRDIAPALTYFLSSPEAIAERVKDADLVIGAVLLRGAKAAYVLTEAMVQTMLPGSVIVDVSIDQGGCVETSEPTSHAEPVFLKHGVIHYCVTNMPGAYPRTSTLALTSATLPYVRRLADAGLAALRDAPGFAKALNIHQGFLTCRPAAEGLGLLDRYRAFKDLI
jgi:alanine dehydrogenase